MALDAVCRIESARAEVARGVHPVEVACDESGSEGEKLIGGNTEVFCHASVGLTEDEAADCVRELRAMIRSPAAEYKSGHLLRDKNRRALEWFLGRDGPVWRRANAFLVDKTFLLLLAFAGRLTRTMGLPVEAVAQELYRAAPRWGGFLGALNDLMRFGPVGMAASSDALADLAAALLPGEPPGVARDVLGWLDRDRAGLGALLRTARRPDPTLPLAMDPLIPAILRAVDHWGAGGAPVSIVHHRHVALTDMRIARIAARRSTGLFALRLINSGADTRVQVADYLAGVARKLASDELAGTADPVSTALLREYADPNSIWGDAASRARMSRRPDGRA